MTILYLERHGESEANVASLFAGRSDFPLTPLGVRQATLTADYLEKHVKIDRVYASDLCRARVTGETAAARFSLPVTLCPALREIDGGLWEGMPFADIPKKYPEDFAVWIGDIGHSRPTGGESVAEQAERIVSALRAIAEENDGKTVLVALHATPIRILETLTKYGDLGEMKNVPWVTNASLSVFTYENGTFTCRERSIDAHLADLRTNLPKTI